MASYPVATAVVVLDHSFWDIVPGDRKKFSWTFHDGTQITDMVMLVGKVTKDHKRSEGIRVELSEDIFALPEAEFAVPPEPIQLVTAENPRNLDYVNLFTLPWYMTVNLIDPAVLPEDASTIEPDVFTGFAVAQEGDDTVSYQVWGEEPDNLGNLAYEQISTNTLTARAVLDVALVEEVTTTLVSFPNLTQGGLPAVGSLVLIGDVAEGLSEFAVISAVNPGVDYTLKRGVLGYNAESLVDQHASLHHQRHHEHRR